MRRMAEIWTIEGYIGEGRFVIPLGLFYIVLYFRKNIILGRLFIEENHPVLDIKEWQKYVNLEDLQLI